MNEYRNEQPLDGFISVKDLAELIREIVRQEISKAKFDNKIVGTVTSVPSTGRANITLSTGGNLTNVKVRDGLTVNTNDVVFLTKINGSINNLIVDFKK